MDLTSATWCMEQLSMTTIEVGFSPSKGIMFGIKVPQAKSQNISPSTLFAVISTSRIPLSQHIAAIADILVPRTKRRLHLTLIPLKE